MAAREITLSCISIQHGRWVKGSYNIYIYIYIYILYIYIYTPLCPSSPTPPLLFIQIMCMTEGLPFVGGVAEVLAVTVVVKGIVLVAGVNPVVSKQH